MKLQLIVLLLLEINAGQLRRKSNMGKFFSMAAKCLKRKIPNDFCLLFSIIKGPGQNTAANNKSVFALSSIRDMCGTYLKMMGKNFKG